MRKGKTRPRESRSVFVFPLFRACLLSARRRQVFSGFQFYLFGWHSRSQLSLVEAPPRLVLRGSARIRLKSLTSFYPLLTTKDRAQNFHFFPDLRRSRSEDRDCCEERSLL